MAVLYISIFKLPVAVLDGILYCVHGSLGSYFLCRMYTENFADDIRLEELVR